LIEPDGSRDFDEADLEKPEPLDGPTDRGPGRRVIGIAVAFALVTASGGLLYLLRRSPAPTSATPGPAELARPPAATPEAPSSGEPASSPVPPLDGSDDFIRGLARALSSHPELAAWLAQRELVRTFVVVMSRIAEGASPAKQLSFLAQRDPFRTLGRPPRLSIDARSYARYDLFAAVVASLDAGGCARLYRKTEPLIEEAYRELGEPERGFSAVLDRAFQRLLDVPIVEGPVLLEASSVSYRFVDPRLESLTPAQKHLLRMGPRNMRLVQGKLREIRRELRPVGAG
jgi:hypothetical protein